MTALYIIIYLIGYVIAQRMLRHSFRNNYLLSKTYSWSKVVGTLILSTLSWIIVILWCAIELLNLEIWDKEPPKWMCLIPLICILLTACSKEVQEQVPECQAVTQRFKDTGELIIHWHNVCGEDLVRFRNYPKESPVAWCDNRIMILSIGKDTCKNNKMLY